MKSDYGVEADVVRQAIADLVGPGDRSVHPMHHPLLPAVPELAPADVAGNLNFLLSPLTNPDLGAVVYWATVKALSAPRTLGRQVWLEESTGLVAVVDDEPASGRGTRLSEFEAAVADLGGVVSARRGTSRSAAERIVRGRSEPTGLPAPSPTLRTVAYLIGALRLADVTGLVEKRLGPVGAPHGG